MPRQRTHSGSDEIEQLVREFTAKLEDVIRRAVAEQIREHAESLRPAPVAASKAVVRTAGGVRMCPYPGCGKPAAGPRNRWYCREHRDVPLGLAPAAPGEVGEVKVRRLPPGPTPGEKRRAGPPMECRYPGCTQKSRGPKYNFFCGEHFRELSYDDQRRYAQLWKEQRQNAPATKAPAEPSGPIIRRAGQELRPESAPASETAPEPTPGTEG